MKISFDELDLNISQYTSPAFEGNRQIILTILQKIFVLMVEDYTEGEISMSLYSRLLVKLVMFIEDNNLQDSKYLHYSEIRKELDKFTTPIEKMKISNDQ